MMTTFGNPETFALRVGLLSGPPPEGDPAGARTWAALRMVVMGRNLFLHSELERGVVNEEVCWPAIGIARWLVRGWDAMFHTAAWPVPRTVRTALAVAEVLDSDLATRLDAPDTELDDRDRFVAAHSLRAAAGGAALPDLWFARDGDVVSVAWADDDGGELRFHAPRGEADVPARDFAQAMLGFVEFVAGLLASPEVTPAVEAERRSLVAWIADLKSPQSAFRGLRSETGLTAQEVDRMVQKSGARDAQDFFGLPRGWSAEGTLADVRQSVVAIAFRCVSPVLNEDDLLAVRSALLEVSPAPSAMASLRELARKVPSPGALRDYAQGYELARGLRRVLENVAGPFAVEDHLTALGIPVVDLPIANDQVDGGCICDDLHGPVVFVNPSSERAGTPWGRRMVLAHELCHLLFDRKAAMPLAVISGPWAPPRIERRANAFAVELLLPLKGVEDVVRGRWHRVVDEDLRILMERYGLGLTATSDHVRNLADRRNR